jgi:hypothetical protein
MLVLVASLVVCPAPARAALSPGDQQCLACHATPGLEMPLTSGGTMPIYVSPDGFEPSVHSALGCATCHSDIDLTNHPASVTPPETKRAFSVAMAKVCATCHVDQATHWQNSVHAELVRQGNTGAPVCTGCHSPHTMIKGNAATMETVPCRACHAQIFSAYAGSQHGMARAHGLSASPLCFDCHGAHDINVPSAGAGRRDACLGCHTEATESHRGWLPNVDLHFDIVSCPACHAPRAQRVVNLILYNSATRKEVAQPSGVPEFENLTGNVTTATPAAAASILGTLLRTLNHQDAEGRTIIRGRLEVRTGVEDHQLTGASEAIGTCDTCHRRGAPAFQAVEVSVAGPAGIPIRYSANNELLNSVFSIDAVSGFYALGATRITVLDALFGLALLAGIGWPLAHLSARILFRRLLGRPNQSTRR